MEKLRDAPWPREILEEVSYMPDTFTVEETDQDRVLDGRGRQFDRVIALDEFDLERRRRFASICGFREWA